MTYIQNVTKCIDYIVYNLIFEKYISFQITKKKVIHLLGSHMSFIYLYVSIYSI